jgi:hypothetical protein
MLLRLPLTTPREASTSCLKLETAATTTRETACNTTRVG